MDKLQKSSDTTEKILTIGKVNESIWDVLGWQGLLDQPRLSLIKCPGEIYEIKKNAKLVFPGKQ